jgi:hypothetical protein
MVSNKANLVSMEYTDSGLIAALEAVITDYKNHKNIPLSIYYDKKLGILEATVKYLKENQNLSYHEIAIILNRDDRTIWTTYNKACKKHKELFIASGETIDPHIFSKREVAPLKTIVIYLKSKGMSLTNISLTLNRSYKNIWLTENKK